MPACMQIPGESYVKCIDVLTTRVPHGILAAVGEKDADVLVMGISGYGKQKLGSVTEEISTRATCTTIIIKDAYESTR